ncbi:hypothetical protein CUJ83_08070 [Methanocella sp. CWC-04]|uniref:Diadenylate cyclase n=1 Tax=Methanooceanicella nereidis TaxID=2052831 RepID=A0AAP2RD71_9EURY|nr:diadenylate cyclase [Methanocella sp. CWC-04]MCD1294952.1 hypothetical protein [Methanocella sp. CWC-04]
MIVRDELVTTAEELSKRINAGAIIIISHDAKDIKDQLTTDIPVIIAKLRSGREEEVEEEKSVINIYAKIPRRISDEYLFHKVSRIELMSEAVEMAYLKGLIPNRVVVGIVSLGEINSIITMGVTNIPLIQKTADIASSIDYDLFKAVLNLAIEIGREGREHKNVGTAFIIGDIEKVLKMSHQIILNPYEGHKKKDRNIRDETNWESVKEFAQLDGMFLVDEQGYIVAAGRYLDVRAKGITLVPGLGGRHLAAASMTKITKSIAITVSESTSIVTIYKDGEEVFHIDPRVSIT